MDSKRFLRSLVLILAFILVFWLAYQTFGNFGVAKPRSLNYTDFLDLVENQQVEKVYVNAFTLIGLDKGTRNDAGFPKTYDFVVNLPISVDQLFANLSAIEARIQGVDPSLMSVNNYSFVVDIAPLQQESIWTSILPMLIVVVLFGVMWFFLIRQQQGGNNKAMNFGRSRARLHDASKNKITFADVAGADEEKAEMQEIVEFLKNPRRFLDLGARIPKGVLLVGPPGTGKTYLAKAVAGEAGVPFYSISGSDFVEMFVGVGASRVRDLFDQAKKNSPSIVFIDEIDAVGRHRGAGLGGGHDEREQTLNQLLVEMDGFEVNHGVIVMAATNRADILDPAIMRPGRFDRQITVGMPDAKAREAILQVHARNKPFEEDVSMEILARRTPFFTAADLENVLNEGAILAARNKKDKIGMVELEEAITRVMIGPEKKSRVITEQDKRLVAYHEAGHAVVAWSLPNCDKVHEVSIIPRGKAGGYTMTLPSEERHYVSREKLIDNICELLGGHAAERMVLGDVSTGSTSDLQRASEIARNMITQYGMSEELGPIYLGGDQEVFIGRDLTSTRHMSENFSMLVDTEMRKMVDVCYKRTADLLNVHLEKLHCVADKLMDTEKIDGVEFETIMMGRQGNANDDANGDADDHDGGRFTGALPTPIPQT